MKLWKWYKGRQEGIEYYKFPLWHFRIWKWGFDAYILHYRQAGTLPWHKDVVEKANHHRLNIKLWGTSAFFYGRRVVHKRFIYFRPDKYIHSLWVKSPTIKLSFGFVKFK